MIRILTILLTLGLTSTPVLAKCPYQDKAKGLYQTGSQHYSAKNYGQALDAFTKVQKLCPTVAMIYNLARVNDLAGNSEAALLLYQQYLKLKDPKANAGDIDMRVKALRAKTAADWTDPFEPEPNRDRGGRIYPAEPLPHHPACGSAPGGSES